MGVCVGPEPLRGRPRASILLSLGAPCGQSGASSIPAPPRPAPGLLKGGLGFQLAFPERLPAPTHSPRSS